MSAISDLNALRMLKWNDSRRDYLDSLYRFYRRTGFLTNPQIMSIKQISEELPQALGTSAFGIQDRTADHSRTKGSPRVLFTIEPPERPAASSDRNNPTKAS